jgi:DNA-binding NarL/FixJ family response regulator
MENHPEVPGTGRLALRPMHKADAIVPILKYDQPPATDARPPMKILVVDDHALIREALRSVFRELLGTAARTMEAASMGEATGLVAEHPAFDLVTVDLTLPDGDGLAFLAFLRERHPSVCVVVLSAHHDRETVTRALDQGALGFIPKSASRQVMLSAFRLIFSGGIYVPPEALAGVAGPPQAIAGPPAAPSCLGLTPRQRDVLALMMEGKSNKAICRILDLAEPTVKNHVTAILKATKATNRTEAVVAAGALGLRPDSAVPSTGRH